MSDEPQRGDAEKPPRDNRRPDAQAHILNAASNLLGICFVLITGLKVARVSHTTYLDEIAIATSLFFVLACALSYASIRTVKQTARLERLADVCFLTGLICLTLAVGEFGLGAVYS